MRSIWKNWNWIGKLIVYLFQLQYFVVKGNILIYSQTVNSKIRTLIPEASIRIISYGVEIPMADLTESQKYEVTVIFTDVHDACSYVSIYRFVGKIFVTSENERVKKKIQTKNN